ncbi:hypothetical protein AQBE111736_00240 [Aquirufa beregesia]
MKQQYHSKNQVEISRLCWEQVLKKRGKALKSTC